MALSLEAILLKAKKILLPGETISEVSAVRYNNNNNNNNNTQTIFNAP